MLSRPLEIFFSYAHADEELMNDVRRQLIVYERNGRILKWHDRMIPPGTEWRGQIDGRLEAAQIILLFMSPHFIESRYCFEVEGQVALRRHNAGEASTIPIVLRPCAWDETPFGEIQALPKDAKPISRWPDRDEACLETAKGVMQAVDKVTTANGESASSQASNLSDNIKATDIVYCSRCGTIAGEDAICNGNYTHHNFQKGLETDYCSRCGVLPGHKGDCIGNYLHHSFAIASSRNIHCSRCGTSPGSRSECTGNYTSHSFQDY